ncbi:transcriptional regulator [Burkholderiales bacterium JOSHI_001]|nr:transcriptional regulator [Burkholderiales bacterium JOSHI_001]
MSAAPPPADLRLPSIDGLRAFEAAARLGGYERAADELHVTASAVGKRIATLEDLLGAPLFVRGGKALVLTALGREYLEQVRAGLALLSAVPLHRRSQQRRERLRVVSPPTFARQILVPELESFTTAHPDIELELLLSMPYLGSEGVDADVVIRHGDPAEASLAPLMHDRLLPVAAPGLLARLGTPQRPADLRGLPLLRTPLEAWVPWFRAAGLDWPEPTDGPRLVDLGLTLEAAVSGQGVALARPTLARHWLDTGTLVPLFKITAPARQPYHLARWAQGGPAAQFAQWLQGVCARAERHAQEWLSAQA